MVAVTTITDPSGFAWILDGSFGVWEGPNKKGFHAPTYTHYRDESPAVNGAFWRGVRATPRELIVPIVIREMNRDNLLARRRALIAAISPVKGECVITSAWPDGSSRHIRCRYVDGMEGSQGPGEYGVTVMKYELRFVADEPYMYSDAVFPGPWSMVAATRTEIPIPGADTFYEVVTSSLLADGVSIFNPGDVDAYPVWTFQGPFTSVMVENTETGKSFTLEYAAGTSSNVLYVETDPGKSSIVDESGTNRWNTLQAGYSLWPLVPGNNVLDVSLIGATTGSLVDMSYTPLYEAD